jgi:hypothetical protein
MCTTAHRCLAFCLRALCLRCFFAYPPFSRSTHLHHIMSPFLPIIVLNGLLVVLNVVPVYWQIQQGNSGAISVGVWLVVANLNAFAGLASLLLPYSV